MITLILLQRAFCATAMRPMPSVRAIRGTHPMSRALQINPAQNKRQIGIG
jgi:hypothetical protein